MATMVEPIVTGEAHILDEHGDTKITWDKDNPDEVANARETFNRLTANRKYAAFEQGRGDTKGRRIDAFDPAVEKMVLVPAYAGG